MSVRAFVDTHVLVYAHDAAAGPKHARAAALVAGLWQSGEGVVSTQVLQEFFVNVTRKCANPPTVAEAKAWIADYMYWHVIVNDADAILEAIDLQARHQLSFRDALVVQAAHTAGAELLYSEDLNHGQYYGTVRVQNPFLD